jgi:hypothetical protein
MLLDTLTINHIKKKNIQGIQKFKGFFFKKKNITQIGFVWFKTIWLVSICLVQIDYFKTKKKVNGLKFFIGPNFSSNYVFEIMVAFKLLF